MTGLLNKYKQQIMTFIEGDPNENPWVAGKPQTREIQVTPYDPCWIALFNEQKQTIANQLQDIAMGIHHVGSTAVPGLAAKPTIDIDLIVVDPSDESSYVPVLEKIGFKLTVREPSWYQHRMLKLVSPEVNLHVFAPNSPEHLRHLLFRNWLISHPEDRDKYGQAKFMAKIGATAVMEYNNNKNAVVKEIYVRIFAQLDELLPDLITSP